MREAVAMEGAGGPAAAFLCCIVLALSCISTVFGATDPADVSALNTLYTGFNNDARLTKWVQSAGDPCGDQWLGVTCQGPSVTAIKLSGIGLEGKVEGWVLQKFSKLSVLDLSRNQFDVDIPNMFPPALTELNLSNNQFTGIFPYLLINIATLTSLKLNNNKLNGSLSQADQVFSKLVNLVTLDLSNNKFTGPIPPSVGDMVSLQYLSLHHNLLSGQLPATLSALTSLTFFDVTYNQITGYLPPNFNPRTFRWRDGNQINSQAPPPPPFTPPPPTKNPAPTTPAKSSSTSKSGLSNATVAGIAVAAVLVLAAAAIGVWFFVVRKRPKQRGSTAEAKDIEANHPTAGDGSNFNQNNSRSSSISSRRSWFLPVGGGSKKEKPTKVKVFEPDTKVSAADSPKIKAQPPIKSLKTPPAFAKLPSPISKPPASKISQSSIAARSFAVAELQSATNSFSESNLIGEGTLGCVYRADFPDSGQTLAVKKLDTRGASMVADENDFLNVVEGLSRLQHGNTAELVGYCVEHGQRLLVFKYLGRGTLHELLHSEGENSKGLSWNVRVKIALGAARALEYLHEVCSPPVVHRNFKSANILLDDELNPHVSDCGLEALAPSGSERQVSAQILGTAGYSAPEYAMSGTYTVKSDVYSFGVVMLELLTGRKPLDSSRPRSEQNLVRWATPQLHDIDALARMVDPSLEGVYPAKSLSRLADIVALCVQPEPEFRPPMSEVVQSLVRLMQRATLSKRRSQSEASQSQDIQEPYEYSK